MICHLCKKEYLDPRNFYNYCLCVFADVKEYAHERILVCVDCFNCFFEKNSYKTSLAPNLFNLVRYKEYDTPSK